jgi:hypothetical protein
VVIRSIRVAIDRQRLFEQRVPVDTPGTEPAAGGDAPESSVDACGSWRIAEAGGEIGLTLGRLQHAIEDLALL